MILEKLGPLKHYGTNVYDPEEMGVIQNNMFFCKPKGGFWTSPLYSNHSWKQWCEAEDFRECDEINSCDLAFFPDAKILVIDHLDDLEEALKKYRLDFRKYDFDWDNDRHPAQLDFELIAKDYDAIWLTENGEHTTRYSTPNLYGWDCETVLLLTPNCVYQV